MKNTFKKYIPVIVAAGALMASCTKKESLSPIPQTSLGDAQAFATADRIAQQVNGVYLAVKNGNFLGGRAISYNEVRGEDWLNVTGNSVTALGVSNFSVISSDNQVEGMWSAGFAAINRANVVSEGIAQNGSVVSPAVAARYQGELRFCRALCNFYLSTLYGRRPYNADAGASAGLPLRLTANKGGGAEALARSTMAETFASILNDLTFAEANLPARYLSGDSNVIRAHKNAAIALKQRVFMHMGKYDSAIFYGNKLVPNIAPFAATTGVLHKLEPVFVNVFRAPYTSLESIFSFPMNNTNPPGTQNGIASYQNAEFALNPAGILANTGWSATDARRALATTSATTPRYTKFNDDNNNWVPILRYSEVLLNLAEALARQNTTGVDARAVALLNAVRLRSDATATPFAPTSQTDLIDKILTERRIELLGEGFRSLDIMRQNIAFPAKGSIASVPPTSLSYVWPIPASELLYNTLMTPNQ